jgi:hypothetical protein
MNKIRRVFISHTSEFTKYPPGKSFIDAAVAAVNRAGCVPCDMGYFTARDEKPAKYCHDRVRECDVYIAVIGARYGSPVRDQPALSYTELEFKAASKEPAKTRLIFLLHPDALVPRSTFTDMEYAERQEHFRRELRDAGVMCKEFLDVHELEMFIFQALIAGATPFENYKTSPERIDWPDEKSPYPGLLSLDEKYAELFFGRDQEVDALISKMSEPMGRFLIISGASGSGKSSLVAAGLRGALKKGRLSATTQWEWIRIQPGDGQSPFDPLVWGLKQTFPRFTRRPQDVLSELTANNTTIGKLLVSCLAQDQELVLFIDQLEELFTASFKHEDIKDVLEQLVATTRAKQNRLFVVATVRSEFIARLEESEVVLQVLNSGYHYHLGPASSKMLQDMIDKPAQATGYEFEAGLIDDVLRDAAHEPGSLPLVAYALEQLFKGRQGKRFTRDAYQQFGGVAGAISTKAEQVMKKLEERQKKTFDKVFAELVHIHRDRPPTRKRASVALFIKDDAANQLIEALVSQDCRVLVRAGEESTATVEVAHENLFTAWPKLKDWIDNAGQALRLIDYAEEAAKRWHETGGHLEEIWQSRRAKEIQDALTRFSKNPSPLLDSMLRPQQMLIARLDQDSLSHADRLLIGKKLVDFGDFRPGVGLLQKGVPDIEWIDIENGSITIEGNKNIFGIQPFRISKYLVTNAQFEAFISAEDGYHQSDWWKDFTQRKPPSHRDSSRRMLPERTSHGLKRLPFVDGLVTGIRPESACRMSGNGNKRPLEAIEHEPVLGRLFGIPLDVTLVKANSVAPQQ